MRESQTVEKARCALGAQLAANRRAVGYSQAELAPLTGYSRSTIANVETGRQHVPLDFWQRADAAVNAGGVLAAANDEVEAAARHEREEAARAARAARQAQAEQWRAQHAKDAAQQQRAAGSGWTETIDQAHAAAASLWSGDPGDSDTAAEDASPVGAAVALRWLIAPPDPSAARLDGWRLISSGDLARLHGVRRCLKDIDNAHGGGAALPMAVSYVRREIPQLLGGRYDDATGRGLFEVAAEFQHDVGWMAYDADRQDLAACYFAHALRFAHAAGNRLLGGRILAAMSHQAIYLGHIAEAIDLARAARAGTTQLATPHALAMLAAMEACALAAAGEARLCQRALGDAENALTGESGRRSGAGVARFRRGRILGSRGARLPGSRGTGEGGAVRGKVGGPVLDGTSPHPRPAKRHPGSSPSAAGRRRRGRRRGRGGCPRSLESALGPRVRRGLGARAGNRGS